MKRFVLLVCVFVVALTRPVEKKWESELRRLHDECQMNPKTHMDNVLSPEGVNQTQIRTHTLCITVKSGIQNEQGDIDKAQLRKLLGDEPLVEEIVSKCGNRKGDAALDAAFNLFSCLVEYFHRQ